MKFLSTGLLFISFFLNVFAVDMYDEIASAIQTGNAKQLGSYFDSNVDLSVSSQEDVYSKAQAELLVKDFFSKNQPKTFALVHKGASKEGTMFAVGTLACANGKTFRTSFVMKTMNGKNVIQELRFEVQ